MEKINSRTIPATRENNGPVSRDSDRPGPFFAVVINEGAKTIVGDRTRLPLTDVKTTRRGAVIGGGTSREATQRARRRLAVSKPQN